MKIATIIRKEYRMIVKKKSFIVSTILTPLLMAGFIFLPALIAMYGRGVKTMDIADLSGLVLQDFLEKSTGLKDTLRFRAAKAEGLTEDELVAIYTQKILDKEVDGFILIPRDLKTERKVRFFALNISDFEANRYVAETVQTIISRQILNERAIDPDLVREAIRSVDLETFKVKKKGVSRASSGMEYLISIFMLTILFAPIMAYGQLIMRGILEEKNSRVVEVLISSTNTRTLFYGKVVGIGLAGLTQVFIWILIGVLFLTQGVFKIDPTLLGFLTFDLALYFMVFFTLGYFMYSILFSIVGAAVNTDQEAQQYAAPITYLMLIPFILGVMVTQNPNSLPVVISSLFPLFSPFMMFTRICVAIPPLYQIWLSIGLSTLTIWFLAWLGAKIFRVGMLMYGKKPAIREIIRWVRYK